MSRASAGVPILQMCPDEIPIGPARRPTKCLCQASQKSLWLLRVEYPISERDLDLLVHVKTSWRLLAFPYNPIAEGLAKSLKPSAWTLRRNVQGRSGNSSEPKQQRKQ
jgi:hypothetical protein